MCVNGKKRIIHKKEVYHLYKTASQWVETEASEIMLSLYISREKPFLPLIEQLLACHSVIQTAWSLSFSQYCQMNVQMNNNKTKS